MMVITVNRIYNGLTRPQTITVYLGSI